ncbi:MAG: hypothetical protein N3E37_02195 [Candidatus Micrarchaeota archaeon]|nr:hypothetical protein [Candidatus Micrarchaeota archaeon]
MNLQHNHKFLGNVFILMFLVLVFFYSSYSLSRANGVTSPTMSEVPSKSTNLNLVDYDKYVSERIRPNTIMYQYKGAYWNLRKTISVDDHYFKYRLKDISNDYVFKSKNELCDSVKTCEELLLFQMHIQEMSNMVDELENFTFDDIQQIKDELGLLYEISVSRSNRTFLNTSNIEVIIAESLINDHLAYVDPEKKLAVDFISELGENYTSAGSSKSVQPEFYYYDVLKSFTTKQSFYLTLSKLYESYLTEINQLYKKYEQECRMLLNQSTSSHANSEPLTTSSKPSFSDVDKDYYRTLGVCQNLQNIKRLIDDGEEQFKIAQTRAKNYDFTVAVERMTMSLSYLKKAKMMMTEPIEPVLFYRNNDLINPTEPPAKDYTPILPIEPPINYEHNQNYSKDRDEYPYRRTADLPQKRVSNDCMLGGCSGELCLDKISDSGNHVASVCVYREEYRCLHYSICERQKDGKCDWTITDEYSKCLASINR